MEKYEAAKQELKHIHEVRGREAMFRSRMKWFELGEKPTKFFFNLEENNYEKKLIREVELENGEIISDPVQVNKEIRNFYQTMYTSKINGNNCTSAYEHNQKIDGFTEGLNIPQLNVEEQESLEKDLTIEELKDALASFADKKSPGEGGFTKEFYQTFFDLIGKDLLNSYNDSFHKGSLSITQKRGSITLIPKGDVNLTNLKNWRPISLLNVDYKLLSKVLAKRMELILPKLIHTDQTGFISGRYIGQNVRLLSDIMEFSDSKKIQGILLFVDFEKAFDTLEWSFILKTLEAFNFGDNFKKWVSVLYNNAQSSIMNGGFMTNYFEISRGVWQGCPLSPSFFILAVELLALKIRQNPNCRGIQLPNDQEVKISQFADDTTIITSNVDSLKSHLQVIDWFGTVSGLKLNKKKTNAMWLGTMKHSRSKILECKSTKDPIKVLGSFLSYNQDKNVEENFMKRIRKMKTKLNLWLPRDLTLYGKSLLAKTLGVSQLIYAASMLSGRFLSNSRDSWKAIPNHYFSTHGGVKFLLKCSYNADAINNNLPTFYRELLQYSQEFKNKTKIFSYGNFLLWNNEAITIEKKMLFWKSWFDKKIFFIQDILSGDGNFLTFEEFQNKFRIKINYLQYFQLMAAIPSDLKKKAMSAEVPSHEQLHYSTMVSLSPENTPVDLANMR